LLWLESLTAAIDLAPPLDERKLPPDVSYPERHRRRGLAAEIIPEETVAAPATAELRLDDGQSERSVATSGHPSTGAESVALEDIPLSSPPPSRNDPHSRRPPPPGTITSVHPHRIQAPATPSAPTAVPRPTMPVQLINYSNPHPRLLTPSTPTSSHPDLTPDGKWRPQHNWSPRHDLLYAKRCMAVLLSTTPRKTNLVIMRGRQWIVDWATGALTRWEPLEYDLPVYAELIGPWGVWGPGGSFLRT
jgi:hypothetical protein